MPGLLRGVARTAVVAGTATAVSNRVSRRQQGRWAQQEYQEAPQQAAPAAEPPPAPPADDMSSKIDQLKQLGELKAQGVLTEAEFEDQKRKILSS
ncbi:SHOCT domain-containing protein [Streptomyces avermitilis]|uniref:SHOCT domain-containing protein n=1 Tax=Streptomyces avermitilis TaxID=33903 RepID=UPI0033A6A66A